MKTTTSRGAIFSGSLLLLVNGAAAAPVSTQNADWKTTAQDHRGDIGLEYAYICPKLDVLPTDPVGWGGTPTYTDDTPVCIAAVHAGEITKAGGAVLIEIAPGEGEFTGSTQNGVTTRDYGSWPGSYEVLKRNPQEPLPTPTAPPRPLPTPSPSPQPQSGVADGATVDWTAATNAIAHRGQIGALFFYDCPLTTTTSSRPPLFGTDIYTDDSNPCYAGAHYGAIGIAGGRVIIQILEGYSGYPGSDRNGISSQSWDRSFAGSFSVVEGIRP